MQIAFELPDPQPVPKTGRCAGVYLLTNVFDLVYVGQSSDVVARLAQHRKEGQKQFDRVMYYPVETLEERLHLEAVLILYHKPRYNRGLYLGLHEGRLWEIRWPGKGSTRRRRLSRPRSRK